MLDSILLNWKSIGSGILWVSYLYNWRNYIDNCIMELKYETILC